MLRLSKKKIILTDPSKFGLRAEKVFSTFENNIEIITAKSEDAKINETLEDFENYLRTTSTKIIYA